MARPKAGIREQTPAISSGFSDPGLICCGQDAGGRWQGGAPPGFKTQRRCASASTWRRAA